ncbi:MAG: GntR family transcriptional regulator [Chloroflexi bacterium]|nr:GntR family transcriptional regulator [Chloroflexota bacterium]
MDLDRMKEVVHTPTPAPLHVRLRRAIHAQITDGTLQPGESLPSERVLQQALDVSRATVRQALGALIQAGLLQSIPGTGTFVMEPPATTPATGLIGLVVSTPNFHFFYPQLAAAFDAVIRQSDYGLMMAMHNERADVLEDVATELLAKNVVALAVTPPRYGDVSTLINRMRQQNTPLIFIGRPSPSPSVDSVSTDNHRIGYDATRHLIDLGHRSILHVGLPDYSTGQDRAAGYSQAMQEAGLEPRIVPIDEPRPASASPLETPVPATVEDHLAGPAYSAARACFEAEENCDVTGIFCFNDVVGMGVYKALRDLDLSIPDDVALVSVDNLLTIRHFEVPLTTFALPGPEIGRQGAELLLLRLEDDTYPPQHLLLPATLVKRMSSVNIR